MNPLIFIRKSKRVLFWLVGIPLNIYAFFIKKNSQKWVFGNIQGYRDNSRYLFEYVTENHPEIEAIWIANNEQEKKYIESLGKDSYLRSSWKAKNTLAKSKVGFISVSLRDLTIPISKDFFVVDLFHGIPLKKLGLDTKSETEIVSGITFLNKINRYFLKKSLNRYDIVVSASKLCQERFRTSFGFPEERLPVCGQPRTDVLINGCTKPHEKKECANLPQRFILYVPTWRESGKNPVDYFTLRRWDELLDMHDYKLVIKLHPLTKASEQEENYANIEFLTDSNIEFTHLLYHTDMLITDYSSAMFDYALMARPLFIFTPDAEEYEKNRGLYEPIENLGKEIIFKTEEELLKVIQEGINTPEKFAPYARRISERYNGFSDGNNCKRVVQYVTQNLK